MRKVYIVLGIYEEEHKEVKKILCVCSSEKKATKNAEIAKEFYQIVEIYTEILI